MKKRISFAAMTVMAAALGPAGVGAAVNAQAPLTLAVGYPCPGEPDQSAPPPGCDTPSPGAYGSGEPEPVSPPAVGTYNGGFVGVDAGGGA